MLRFGALFLQELHLQAQTVGMYSAEDRLEMTMQAQRLLETVIGRLESYCSGAGSSAGNGAAGAPSPGDGLRHPNW